MNDTVDVDHMKRGDVPLMSQPSELDRGFFKNLVQGWGVGGCYVFYLLASPVSDNAYAMLTLMLMFPTPLYPLTVPAIVYVMAIIGLLF